MQPINLASVKAAKASDRKSLAILAYDNACADPEGANWRAVADMLRLAMPVTKAKAPATTDSRYAAWADYPIPQNASGKRLGKSPVIVVTFAGGEMVRAPAVSMPGKALNIGRGIRVALSFYLARMAGRARRSVTDTAYIAGLDIPAVTSCICETTGAEFDPAQCAAAMQAAKPEAPVEPERTEYGTADLVALAAWTQTRPGIESALKATCGELWVTKDRAARMGFAVMTFWPDMADDELQDPAPSPVAPAFKIPRAVFATSSLTRIGKPLPVAPSCILQVAA